MKVLLCLLFILITGLFICGILRAEEPQWEYSGYGIKETYAKIVSQDPVKKAVIYAATDYFVYASMDNGKNYKEIFVAPGRENSVNFIAPGAQGSDLLAGAQDGLYAVSVSGGRYKKIYSGAGTGENKINCIAVWGAGANRIYIASDKGLFFSEDAGGAWSCVSAALGRLSVNYVVLNQDGDIYIASDKGIFLTKDNGKRWKKVYSVLKKDIYQQEDAEEAVEEDEEAFFKINCLAVNPQDADEIYAATSRGVMFSKDRGKNWAFMTSAGLGRKNIRYLLIYNEALAVVYGNASIIYAAGFEGVFRYDEGAHRWSHLYKGASFRDAQFLSIDPEAETLWVAADGGIFKLAAKQKDDSKPPLKPLNYGDVSLGFKNEPSIRQVQSAAIKYAEVHPDKIRNWRNQARFKPLLPELDLSYDKNVSISSTTNNFTVGPKDWGISFKWDVGDLLFNTDQTSIDVRSRLMVQLRDDILDEVTRLYYERRRLQAELAASPPKNEKARYEKLLRLEELTAGIDGLTGGYFSQ